MDKSDMFIYRIGEEILKVVLTGSYIVTEKGLCFFDPVFKVGGFSRINDAVTHTK